MSLATRRQAWLALTLCLAACGAPAGLEGPRPPATAPAGATETSWRAGALGPRTVGPRRREGGAVPHLTGAFLVLLAPGRTAAGLLASSGLAGTAVTGTLQLGARRLVRVSPPPGIELPGWRQALEASPGVAGVYPEGRRLVTDAPTPAPDLGARQWSHRPAFADGEGAWAVVPDAAASKVVVAVIDTGLDATHPEFQGRIAPGGVNTVAEPPTGDTQDDQGHGTHCAGIVAAANDGAGVRGVSPGARILPIKALDASGSGSDLAVLSGLMAAIAWRPTPDDGSRVRVVSMSLGASFEDVDSLYTQAIALARQAGIVVVIAAGNDGFEFVTSPATSPGAIAVGSTGRYLGWERLSGFSNAGARLALVAPGEDILSTYPLALGDRTGYETQSGTSMATPYVAGVVALLAARYDPGNTRLDAAWADAVRARLLTAVDDLGPPGRDEWHGAGRINARLAVEPATLAPP